MWISSGVLFSSKFFFVEIYKFIIRGQVSRLKSTSTEIIGARVPFGSQLKACPCKDSQCTGKQGPQQLGNVRKQIRVIFSEEGNCSHLPILMTTVFPTIFLNKNMAQKPQSFLSHLSYRLFESCLPTSHPFYQRISMHLSAAPPPSERRL